MSPIGPNLLTIYEHVQNGKNCQKRQFSFFADSAFHRKKIVVFDNTCQKEQELSFLP